ncbi:50S ribosomal protein L29 [Candidatus Pacearchaeota archaeon]|nr:50S ribosomal protein L29 [Candidatus Pacearchaeota archaeon]
MAILKIKDAVKLSRDERMARLKDLKMELIKSMVGANKSNAKTKEIKRAIARISTLNSKREEGTKK